MILLDDMTGPLDSVVYVFLFLESCCLPFLSSRRISRRKLDSKMEKINKLKLLFTDCLKYHPTSLGGITFRRLDHSFFAFFIHVNYSTGLFSFFALS